MGNFGGHATPGTFFIWFGAWWAFACLRRFMVCKRDGIPFVSTAIFSLKPVPDQLLHYQSSNLRPPASQSAKTLRQRIPAEGVVKIVCSMIGMAVEILAHVPGHLPPRIVQHTTMYAFFLLAGVVDIACELGIVLPEGIQHVGMALALAVEGILFAGHVHGRDLLDVHIHLLLVKVIALTVIVLLLEVRFRRSALLTMGRSFLLILQGTWFWAIAVILYKHGEGHSEWDLNSPESVMQATIYFSWHCAAIFVFLLLMNVFIYVHYIRRASRTTSTTPRGTTAPFKALENDDRIHGVTSLVTENDMDSDDSFEMEDAKELLTV